MFNKRREGVYIITLGGFLSPTGAKEHSKSSTKLSCGGEVEGCYPFGHREAGPQTTLCGGAIVLKCRKGL